ncbi:MAG: dipeptidase [Candidatus Alcyoniella australis]|nr:dipeptidase [Candidatus Alcyoniella australis]
MLTALLALPVLLAGLAVLFWTTDGPQARSAESHLATTPVPKLIVDLHCDTLNKLRLNGGELAANPRLQVDLERLAAAGLNGQVFMSWSSTQSIRGGFSWKVILAQLDIFDAQSAASNGRLRLVRNAVELDNTLREGRIAAFLGLEGAYCLEDDLGRLEQLAQRGVRIVGPVWNHHNDFCDSATQSPPRWNGLSPLGNELVARCNELGLLIDAAHAAPQTIADILEQSSDPIIDTHSACRALCDHPRNLSDEQIRTICGRGGVVGVLFHSPHLVKGRRATLEDVLDHIEHVVQVGGVQCAAIGSDFDGNIVAAKGLEDVSRRPELLRGLQNRGYSDEQLALIAGGNFARVFRQVCDK